MHGGRIAGRVLLAGFAAVLIWGAPAEAQVLDTSFGDEGYADLPSGGTDIDVYPSGGLAGRILTTRYSGGNLELTRLLADGVRDPGFGGAGTLTLPADVGTPTADAAQAAIDAEGRILVTAGTRVYRLLGDGSFDPAFDGDGRVDIDFTHVPCADTVNPCHEDVLWVGSRADGIVLVIARVAETIQHSPRPNARSFVAALEPDGSPWLDYGANGGVEAGGRYLDAAAIAPDGTLGRLGRSTCYNCPSFASVGVISPDGKSVAASSLCCPASKPSVGAGLTALPDGSFLSALQYADNVAGFDALALAPVPLDPGTMVVANRSFQPADVLLTDGTSGHAVGEAADQPALVGFDGTLTTTQTIPIASPFDEAGVSDAAGHGDGIVFVGDGSSGSFVGRISLGEKPPPETTLDAAPPALGNDPYPVFGFSSPDPEVTFECRIPPGPFGPCASPLRVGPVTDGGHTFEVRAVDSAGAVDPTPASWSFEVDTAAPETVLDERPSSIGNDPTPLFSFTSPDPDAEFECRIRPLPFGPCTSPNQVDLQLSEGVHIFDVRAVDLAGNADPTPETWAFTVDTTPPDTTILSGPDGGPEDPTPTFSFATSEPEARFFCRVRPSDDFAACASTHTLDPLPDGAYVLEVVAVDSADNVDPSSATRPFAIEAADTPSAGEPGDEPPAGGTADAPPRFRFDVLRRRIPNSIGKLLRRGVSAKVECTRHCRAKLLLTARGSAARKAGLNKVIARGGRDLYADEPKRVDAFVGSRAAAILASGSLPSGTLKLRAKITARPR